MRLTDEESEPRAEYNADSPDVVPESLSSFILCQAFGRSNCKQDCTGGYWRWAQLLRGRVEMIGYGKC
jgi:hypothetical protein